MTLEIPKSALRSAAVLVALFVLTGCGTYRQPGVAALSSDESAVLVLPYPVMYAGIFVTHVDCRSRGMGLYKRFELHPGWRVLTFSGNRGMYVPENPKNYVFRAEPGAVYTFERNYDYRPDDWIIEILDQESGEAVESWWEPAEWSYWNGPQPDEAFCERVAELERG